MSKNNLYVLGCTLLIYLFICCKYCIYIIVIKEDLVESLSCVCVFFVILFLPL